MARPYVSFQIDRLEAEFERAREESDKQAIEDLKEELAIRRPSPRVTRLRQLLLSDGASSRGTTLSAPSTALTAEQHQPAVAENTRNREPASQPIPATSARHPAIGAPSFRPTPEQEHAVEAFRSGGALKINAYAGTGKTSTLQLLAHSTSRKGQYLAFNKKIVFDSRGKFPPDVNCSTTHSLAFRSLAGRYSNDQLVGKLTANKLVEILELKNWRVDRNHVLAARSQAFLILSTIRRFCQSAEPQLTINHVPRHGSLSTAPNSVVKEVAAVALKGAEHVWERMVARDDPIPLGHDGYLKAWALAEPRLPADYILLDEAQDTNPVVLGLMGKQDAQMVYVGDKYQQIYEWRGAVNAMAEAVADHTAYLTTSFRFGGDVARAANSVLARLGETKKLIGNPARNSRIGSVGNGTVLARTNATTIAACIEALDVSKKPHLVGGTDDLMAMLRGVKDLKEGQPSSVPEFFGFENWQQVLEFVRSGEGEELLTFVNLVEARGESQLLWALNRVVDEDECDLVISTAHKAKGREWSEVRLMDDFLKSVPKKKNGSDNGTLEIDPSELRLLYVALTRAKDILELPAPMIQFLATGQLQPSEPTAWHPREVLQSATPRTAMPKKEWTPPRNWGEREGVTNSRSQASESRIEPAARQTVHPSTARPQAKRKGGLLRWLIGN
jgi:hypothetical protein